MNRKMSKRQRDIKSKLMAAICMLLVSSIMMVSTTYAWFTLSTAPEVTGISTAVGANGNLEIALLPKDGLTETISTAVGDSIKAVKEKNITWGNLVDLSDGSIYGLDGITLYPAALNAATYADGESGKLTGIDAGSLLMTPNYGGDGRVAALVANTSNGYFDSVKKDFYPIPATLDLTNNPDAGYGVRAIGTASGMTARQLAYRNARAAGNTAASQAKSVASSSLNNNGSTLANIAIKKGTNSSPSFDMADLNSMKAIIDDLLGTDTKTGALQYIETAYKQYILAYAASGMGPADAEGENAIHPWQKVDALTSSPLADMVSGLTNASVTLPTELSTAISKYTTTLGNVTSAKTQLDGLITSNKPSYTWDEIDDVLKLLADPDQMKVNGIIAGDIMEGDNMSALVNSVASSGLKVTMATGGGVYADIADQSGDYTASVVIEEVTYDKLTLKNMTARMETASGVKPAYLTGIGTVVENAGAPASGDTTDQPITDMFGYVIDLAFRTNAAESSLLLQGEAVDRIYSDNANEETMGSGSNMTFTAAGGLSEKQVTELMDAIRLVFFNPDNGAVIKSAKLDTPVLTDGEWKANIQFIDVTKDATTKAITETPVTDNELMALTQNTAHKLSVLVYLDGNKVGNEQVAAQVANSLTGKLNLQFASSATLVPMDYAQLHTPQTAGGTGGAEQGGAEQGNAEQGQNP